MAAVVLSACSSEEPVPDYLTPLQQPRPPRLTLVRDFLDRSAPAVRAHLESVAAHLAAAGARVREVAGHGSDEEAAGVVRRVLRSLARSVPGHLCGRLAQGLPAELAVEVEDACGGDPLVEAQGFIGPLVKVMEVEAG